MEPGVLEIVADGRAPLRLAKDLNRSGTDSTGDRADHLRVQDFIGSRLGRERVKRPDLSPPPAIREAANEREIVQAIRRHRPAGRDPERRGEEAYAFRGAIQGLPIGVGLHVRPRGGSLEITASPGGA
ncbi:MAG: hypothetical protein IPK72_21545 [Candidatus Eisenbacteria bacterium]|nr:hypothetical protein [Candidatus Eisenbacteria bacterium]